MLSHISSAISTTRYWRSIVATQRENARSVDRDSQMRALASIRPDAPSLLETLERVGIVVVPDYWSSAQCAAARSELDRLIVEHPDAVRHFSKGADKRMFGVEMVSELLARFHSDPFLKGLGEAYSRLELYNFATLGARIDASDDNSGSGDGWHRDGFGFQYKTILYLSDVDLSNGPFEYLPGSHKPWRVATDTAIGGLPAAPQSRIAPELVDTIVSRAKLPRRTYVAPAGSLIIANVSGIHRGAPLLAGSRHALTNYYYHPYQVGTSLIEKFNPMMPGTTERVLEMLAARESAARKS